MAGQAVHVEDEPAQVAHVEEHEEQTDGLETKVAR